MFAVRELSSVWKGFKGRVSAGSYEDGMLALLAVAAVSYTKNIVYNWKNPEIVRFDIEVLQWILIGYIAITVIQGVRKYFERLGSLKNEEFDLKLAKLRVEVKQLVKAIEP